jgi:hypothetical protein
MPGRTDYKVRSAPIAGSLASFAKLRQKDRDRELSKLDELKDLVKEYIAVGGCMHKLRVHVPVDGEDDKPWTQQYITRDQPCIGRLGKGGNHLVTNLGGQSVPVHETKDGKRWM